MIAWLRSENTSVAPNVRDGKWNFKLALLAIVVTVLFGIFGELVMAFFIVGSAIAGYSLMGSMWSIAARKPTADRVTNAEVLIVIFVWVVGVGSLLAWASH